MAGLIEMRSMKTNPRLSQLGLLFGPIVLVSLAIVAAFWFGRLIGGGSPTAAPSTPGLRDTATVSPPTVTPTNIPTVTPGATPTPEPTATPIVRPRPIRELGHLITADQEFTVWQTYEEQPSWWPFPFWTNKIILIAVGRVQAGIDLEKLADGDVVANGTQVEITLPSPEFFGDPNLDLTKTAALEGSSFNPISMDWNEMIQAQLAAEAAIQDRALETGLLENARKNAAMQIELLLRRIGATEVTIKWRDLDR
jgi:hypothetical protein